MTTATTATRTIHPFEKAGLGKAPFRYAGVVHQEISHGQRVLGSVGGVEFTTKPGGTCDFCGTYILNMFAIESADGQRSTVGCDCIAKVDAVVPIVGVSRLIKDKRADKRAREDARIAAAASALPEAHRLGNQPHPLAWRAEKGDTMIDWCRWMFANAGRTGKLNAARVVELAIAPAAED